MLTLEEERDIAILERDEAVSQVYLKHEEVQTALAEIARLTNELNLAIQEKNQANFDKELAHQERISALNDRIITLGQYNELLSQHNSIIAERDAALNNSDPALIAQRDLAIQEKNAAIAEKNAAIADKSVEAMQLRDQALETLSKKTSSERYSSGIIFNLLNIPPITVNIPGQGATKVLPYAAVVNTIYTNTSLLGYYLPEKPIV